MGLKSLRAVLSAPATGGGDFARRRAAQRRQAATRERQRKAAQRCQRERERIAAARKSERAKADKRVAAALARRGSSGSRKRTDAHPQPDQCRDRDCQRPTCVWYQRGHGDGFDQGHAQGYMEGEAAGYSAGAAAAAGGAS